MMSIEKENEEYISNLYSINGKDARNYLKERNISVSTAKFWKLGFSPHGFIPQNHTSQSKKMNGRITIPVYNSNDKLIAFSGRSIYNESPKYMHYVFPTRSMLFGLSQNKQNILQDNFIIFVEGQFDVIMAWQYGLKNCVCTFGAHCSEAQYALASRYTNRIFIMYDNDNAGIMGASECMDKNNTYNEVTVKNLNHFFQPGDDMDSWIRNNNPEILLKYINETSQQIFMEKMKNLL
jgi:DNA primase catalytic core